MDDLTLEQMRKTLGELERSISSLKDVLLPTPSRDTTPFTTEQIIRLVLKMRRLRDRQLGSEIFADPAWDILLETFAAQLSDTRISISTLCHASAVPPTTALRWIHKLEADGWLLRRADRFDGRRSWIELSSDGTEKLQRLFSTATSVFQAAA